MKEGDEAKKDNRGSEEAKKAADKKEEKKEGDAGFVPPELMGLTGANKVEP
tara:strand:+ start:614 stop:766 length:153 start_codon:yes stop_codon:yes gene_type:complete